MASTPASLLDLIARGGSIVGSNESDASRANTALTQARVPVEQAQVPLIQAQTTGAQAAAARQELENEQARQQIRAAQAMGEIFAGGGQPSVPTTGQPAVGATPGFAPGTGGPPTSVTSPLSDPQGTLVQLLRRGIPYQYATGAVTQMLGLGQAAAKLTQEQRANSEAVDAKVGSLLQNLQSLPVEQRGAALQQELPALKSLDPQTNWDQLAQGPLDDNTMSRLVGAKAMHSAILASTKTEAETKKETAQAGQATAEAGLATAKTAGAEAESKKQQIITDAMQKALADPSSGEQSIKDALPLDPTAAGSYLAAWKAKIAAGDVQGAAEEVGKAAAHNALISQAINPQVRAGKVAEAVAVENATSPVKIAQSIATAKALRQGDNPAVAGVAPAAVGQVQNDAIKLDEAYIQAKSAAEAVGSFIDLAERGNKVAGSNVPVMGAETASALNGIRRISPAQVAGNEHAGSLLDQIKGKIGKLAVGQPIPKDVLEDMRDFQQSLGDAAYSRYTSGLNSLNQRTGAKFSPAVEAPKVLKTGAAEQGGYQKGHLYNGLEYLGGDPNKQENWKQH